MPFDESIFMPIALSKIYAKDHWLVSRSVALGMDGWIGECAQTGGGGATSVFFFFFFLV